MVKHRGPDRDHVLRLGHRQVSVYESPARRRLRAAVDEAHDDADFTARLIDAITNDENVRAAIIRVTRRANPPTTKTATTRGRSR